MQDLDQYLNNEYVRHVEDLKTLLRIPTISADSRHKADMERGADFVRKQMVEAGLEAEIVPTPGHPIVWGKRTGIPGVPTVMVYGHYDVQPVDPLDLWITPPFEPTIRENKIYARGATDDKGQMLTHMKALEAWWKVRGKLPVNVHFIVEGEEEVGSKNLDNFLEKNRDAIRSDVAVVSDTSQYGPGIPAITYGLRGIIACQITFEGPKQDLHSGIFGGAITNPVNALARVIGNLHDASGRVTIPDFYEGVVPLSAEERRQFSELPGSEADFFSSVGVTAGKGEEGFTSNERRWARPTCDVNGIAGGYQGEGPKTIIPSKAIAKITCRLVPNQDPDKILSSLERVVMESVPPGIKAKFERWHGCRGMVFNTKSPYMNAAKQAIETAFGRTPVFIREGGSIPVVLTFQESLGVDTLLLGWGLNTDNLHSPNEHFSLDNYRQGIRASTHLWNHLSECSPAR